MNRNECPKDAVSTFNLQLTSTNLSELIVEPETPERSVGGERPNSIDQEVLKCIVVYSVQR